MWHPAFLVSNSSLIGSCAGILLNCVVCNVQTLWVDPYRGLRTLRHDLTLDRGLSFEAACRRLEHERKDGDRYFPRTLFIWNTEP